jgi:hypothetical protein
MKFAEPPLVSTLSIRFMKVHCVVSKMRNKGRLKDEDILSVMCKEDTKTRCNK